MCVPIFSSYNFFKNYAESPSLLSFLKFYGVGKVAVWSVAHKTLNPLSAGAAYIRVYIFY